MDVRARLHHGACRVALHRFCRFAALPRLHASFGDLPLRLRPARTRRHSALMVHRRHSILVRLCDCDCRLDRDACSVRCGISEGIRIKPENFPLFVFVIGSPFFFKNFAIALGHFDIYGCLWALVALLIPVGAVYPLVIAAGCVVLVLMHHLHLLLYVPTIGFIIFVRYGLLPGFSAGKAIYGIALIVWVSAAFLVAAFFGRMPVPPETFLAYVRSRALDPIDPSNAWMWYSTLEQEIRSTWERLGIDALRFPVYALLIALHFPIGRYLKALIVKLPTQLMRRSSVVALAAITAAYIPICIVAHDYARWVSSWAVCMFLAMHAIRMLPSTVTESAPPLAPDSKTNLLLGWIVTAIPRVGVTIPF